MSWEQANGDLLEADVIGWQEAIWPLRKSRRKKPRPIGKQAVVGQIFKIEGDFITLQVLKAEVTENLTRRELQPYRIGQTITKKRQTLTRGNPERLHWSEEDVRAALLAERHQTEELPT